MTRWASTEIIRESAEDRLTSALSAWMDKYRKPSAPITEADIKFMRRCKNRAPSRMVLSQESKERIVWQKEVV